LVNPYTALTFCEGSIPELIALALKNTDFDLALLPNIFLTILVGAILLRK